MRGRSVIVIVGGRCCDYIFIPFILIPGIKGIRRGLVVITFCRAVLSFSYFWRCGCETKEMKD